MARPISGLSRMKSTSAWGSALMAVRPPSLHALEADSWLACCRGRA